jgi:hypothetical protein
MVKDRAERAGLARLVLAAPRYVGRASIAVAADRGFQLFELHAGRKLKLRQIAG